MDGRRERVENRVVSDALTLPKYCHMVAGQALRPFPTQRDVSAGFSAAGVLGGQRAPGNNHSALDGLALS
jgi:hypothetical protein